MSVQNRHRPWSSHKQTPLTLKCNTMMWAIRVTPGVMTVTERHLQRKNFDGNLHTQTTTQFPNFLCLKCSKKQRVLMNYMTKFESFQFRSLCTSDTLLITTKCSVHYILTLHAYLPHVSVLVHHHQAEQLCRLLEQPATIMTLL